MASGANYSFKFNGAKIKQLRTNVDRALTIMAEDIETKAHSRAPHDSGDLKNSFRTGVEENGSVHFVKVGGTSDGYEVPYAKLREYENNKNPQTKFYMKNAFEEVMGNYQKYFKGVTK